MMTDGWNDVAALDVLKAKGRMVVKPQGKQIALFWTGDRVLACNNRCPHEGYPLSEGDLGGDKDCILTCNWHNWKFDLESGETLVGGDALRRYPVRVEEGRVLLDLTDAPVGERIAAALDSLVDAFDRHEYDRMAREVARLMKAGGDSLDALRRTISETADRFEYGATHALPASADWLSLRQETAEDPVRSLALLTESIGHFAWDTRREPRRPYATEARPWDEDSFVAAVEAEDEATAIATVNGAVADGLNWAAMERGFARAALAHYADFGHSAIYTYKMRALSAHLGDSESLGHLARLLTRSLVYASREDLIPEFKAYAPSLQAWDGKGASVPLDEDLRKDSVKGVLSKILAGSAAPDRLYDAVMAAASWQLLHFDLSWQQRTDGSVSQNINWLDFTHAITFGNAVRKLAESYPALWPAALLQIGCFLGRNSGYTDPDLDEAPWRSNDPMGDVTDALERVEDHGQFEYIVACHLLKMSYAVREELKDRPGAAWHPTLVAALKRFLAGPLKRKHTLRVARQSLAFVQAEG